MSSYWEKLKSPRWQRKRLQIFERDNFQCQGCGTEDETLHVHHLRYSRGEPWDVDNDDLVTLCGDCHQYWQNLQDQAKEALAIILQRIAWDASTAQLEHFSGVLTRLADDESLYNDIIRGRRSIQTWRE